MPHLSQYLYWSNLWIIYQLLQYIICTHVACFFSYALCMKYIIERQQFYGRSFLFLEKNLQRKTKEIYVLASILPTELPSQSTINGILNVEFESHFKSLIGLTMPVKFFDLGITISYVVKIAPPLQLLTRSSICFCCVLDSFTQSETETGAATAQQIESRFL